MADDKKPMKVYAKSCSNCLFAKSRIVSGTRADTIIDDCIKNDHHFTCHKASMKGEDVCCHSFFKIYGDRVKHLRFAKMFDLVEFLELPDDTKLPAYLDFDRG